MILKSEVIVEVPDGRLFVYQGIELTQVLDGHLILIDEGGERAAFAPGNWSNAQRVPVPALEAA